METETEEPAEQMETEVKVEEEEVEEVEEEVELPTPAQLGRYTQFKEQFTEPPEDNLKHHSAPQMSNPC